MIKGLDSSDIIKRENNVFIFAPNFEERSMGGVMDLMEQNLLVKNCGILSITLQARKPKEILDAIKSENTNILKSGIKKLDIAFQDFEIKYPILEYNGFFFEILEFCRLVSKSINLYIDISSLPRSIIFRFFDFLFKRHYKGKIEFDNLTFESLNFIYTPALKYPGSVNIDILGKIVGMYTELPFHRIVKEYDLIDLILFTAGNSHDAAQVYSLTNENNKSSIERHLMVYLDQNNLHLSFSKMTENIGVLNRSRLSRDNLNYVFNYEHVGLIMINKVKKIVQRHKGSDSFLAIGAFGPKPVSLCSYLTKVHYEFLLETTENNSVADVLTHDSAQYTSIYSIGRKPSKVFNIDICRVFTK